MCVELERFFLYLSNNIIDIKRSKLNASRRLVSLELNPEKLHSFFDITKQISVRDLDFIPYYRHLIAYELNKLFNGELQKFIKNILQSYEAGAFFISIGNVTKSKDDFIKFSTAISHLLGTPNIDLLSGKYYATFTIKHDDEAPINLLRPYENFRMHTDGAFMHEPTDWISFMKMHEENVLGGETKLLHMQDWNDFQFYYEHKCALNKFEFTGPPSSDKRSLTWGNHRKTDSLDHPILRIKDGKRSIRFVDQFLHPKNVDEAMYISDIQDSLEASKNLISMELPTGSLLVINNHIWVHGRNKFESNGGLKRELMRQRGAFYQ